MNAFWTNYGASILAGLTIPLIIGLLYWFRNYLIRWFWEASEKYVQDLIPTKTETETVVDEVVDHSRTDYRLDLNGKREFEHDPPTLGGEFCLRLIDIDGGDVILEEISFVNEFVPFTRVEEVEEADGFRIEANRDRNLRGKLIRFADTGGEACTTLIHAENVNEDKGEATVVVESFYGRISGDYEHGLG